MELPVKIAAAAVKFTYFPAASECRATFSNLDPNVNNVAAYVREAFKNVLADFVR